MCVGIGKSGIFLQYSYYVIKPDLLLLHCTYLHLLVHGLAHVRGLALGRPGPGR